MSRASMDNLNADITLHCSWLTECKTLWVKDREETRLDIVDFE